MPHPSHCGKQTRKCAVHFSRGHEKKERKQRDFSNNRTMQTNGIVFSSRSAQNSIKLPSHVWGFNWPFFWAAKCKWLAIAFCAWAFSWILYESFIRISSHPAKFAVKFAADLFTWTSGWHRYRRFDYRVLLDSHIFTFFNFFEFFTFSIFSYFQNFHICHWIIRFWIIRFTRLISLRIKKRGF